jgi:hypothetical protein
MRRDPGKQTGWVSPTRDRNAPVTDWPQATARANELRPDRLRANASDPESREPKLYRDLVVFRSRDVAVGGAWADAIWTRDQPLAAWLVEQGAEKLGEDPAFRIALECLRGWTEHGIPSARLMSDDEVELVNARAAWRLYPVGRMPGARNIDPATSPAARWESLSALIWEMYPHPVTRRGLLTRKGGAVDLIAEYRRRFPNISRSTAYADLKQVLAESFPMRKVAR